jgi:hypothetical protein
MLVKFGGPWNKKCSYILWPFWNILQPLDIIYSLLVFVVCGHLVCFSVLVCLDQEKSGNLVNFVCGNECVVIGGKFLQARFEPLISRQMSFWLPASKNNHWRGCRVLAADGLYMEFIGSKPQLRKYVM